MVALRILVSSFVLLFISCQTSYKKPVDYVNPFSGTAHRGIVHIDSYGGTYPGAVILDID